MKKLTGENAANGNWVPPSYAKAKGLTYSGITGGLYRGLLAQVEKNVNELKKMRVDGISIKGGFGMQGENDRTSLTEYEAAFTYDIRAFAQRFFLKYSRFRKKKLL